MTASPPTGVREHLECSMPSANSRQAITSRLRRMPVLRSLAGCDAELARILPSEWRILDVGCGAGSRSAPDALARAIGVDIHFPSVAQIIREGARAAAICSRLEVLPLQDSIVDAIVALDVVEHFGKDDALGLLREFERVASRAIVLLTPNGYLPQRGTVDNPFMEHRSGWSATELASLGYTVSGVNGWRHLRGPLATPHFGPIGKALSLASQPAVRRHPDRAFHLLAVKSL